MLFHDEPLLDRRVDNYVKVTMRIARIMACFVFFLLAACGNGAADAQKTLDAFLAAAKAGDGKTVDSLIPPAERKKRRFNFTDENNPYKDETYEVVKIQVDRELAVFTMKVTRSQGPERETKFVCVNEDGKWYVSVEKSAQALLWKPEVK